MVTLLKNDFSEADLVDEAEGQIVDRLFDKIYDRLKPEERNIGQASNWSHLTHIKTCLWMIVALIHTGSVNLTKWSIYLSIDILYF